MPRRRVFPRRDDLPGRDEEIERARCVHVTLHRKQLQVSGKAVQTIIVGKHGKR